ncbi:MAG: aminoacyl-histidine dipeptidase [Bacteroidales bacterium]|nr:aminoacyl-histidine dipeptidase [Bacteroidales bacterium]MBP5373528.1 aminoacyl-histidine dipeptidase [Bacteroidales bacterium]
MSIKDLEPKVVWGNFYGLTQIPRPSKHEGKVIDYLYNWGVSRGLETIKDPTGNIIIRVPATPGFENRKGVILQGHMDMVPQKTSDSKHDFLNDPIVTLIDGDWVTADRTTLGADNGIGVAMGLAVLEDPSVKHGPVEVLVTYDEETGMTGANCLQPGVLKGDILINLDSEEEGELCVGCAGGLDASAAFKYLKYKTPAGHKGLKITVKGLQGGHSGMDISLYRANANKVLCRILLPLVELFGAKVVSFTGGSLRNAIPFEACAEIVVPEENLSAVKSLIDSIFAEVKAEYKESDPSAVLYVDEVSAAPKFIQGSVMLRAIKAIIACPSNVIRMSQSMSGLTETSINLAIVRTEKGRITVHCLMRSAVDSAKADLAERVRCIFELAGADSVEFKGGYSGWTPRLDTPMNKVMTEQFQKVYGRPMTIRATHGGLECAIMGAKYPNWEMVSVGPTIKYPHSPDERLYIPSVARTWEYLKAVLENVPVK